MKAIETVKKIGYPIDSVLPHFTFSVFDTDGVFSFEFHYFNAGWNCWVTLPDGTVRQAGVYPNVISWSGYLDYGLYFKTDLAEIKEDSLLLATPYLIKWK